MRRALLALLLFGCGPDAHLVTAQQTTAITAGVVTEADATLASSGGEAPDDARGAFAHAEGWQERLESMVDVWERRGSGERGYLLYSACLRAALVRLKETWTEAELRVPAEIDQAIALLEEGTGEACAEPE